MLDESLDTVLVRNFARTMDVRANIVRSMLESGERLRAHKIMEGVRLTHEEFLRLYDFAKDAMWHAAAER